MIKVRAMLLIFCLFFLFSCGKEESKKTSVIQTKIIDGIKNVYNPSQPLQGVVKAEVEKIFQIDPASVDTKSKNPANFFRFQKDKEGNIYIFDRKNFKIYRFSKNGKYTASFLEKGQGPGEFQYEPSILFSGDHIWLQGVRKIAKFDTNGKFIEERKLNRIYRQLQIVDEKKFIAVFTVYENGKQTNEKNRNRVSALIGEGGNILYPFLKVKNMGITVFKKETTVKFYHPLVTPDILHAYSQEKELAYIVLSNEYKIYVKTLTGDTKLVIHRDYQQKKLDKNDQKEVLEVFQYWPEPIKSQLKGYLPQAICIFRFIKALPNGYIGLVRYKDVNEVTELDIFDPEGRFIYTVQSSEEITNFIKVSFSKNKRVGTLKRIDDKDVYVEYRVKNLLELFEN